jgi:hypothetical protein
MSVEFVQRESDSLKSGVRSQAALLFVAKQTASCIFPPSNTCRGPVITSVPPQSSIRKQAKSKARDRWLFDHKAFRMNDPESATTVFQCLKRRDQICAFDQKCEQILLNIYASPWLTSSVRRWLVTLESHLPVPVGSDQPDRATRCCVLNDHLLTWKRSLANDECDAWLLVQSCGLLPSKFRSSVRCRHCYNASQASPAKYLASCLGAVTVHGGSQATPETIALSMFAQEVMVRAAVVLPQPPQAFLEQQQQLNLLGKEAS